ncbi:MAG: metal-dependent hydrolase [Chloroflexi bacterium]|nr:metal-dependent hydrolase [Chloroflexota bacterium]
MAFILLADSYFEPLRRRPAILAVLDEPEHVITSLLLLGLVVNLVAFRRYWLAVALPAFLIDIDHVPQLFHQLFLTSGTGRPYTHSLSTVVLVLLVTLMLPAAVRGFGWAVAFGLATHFLRDLFSGPISLLWPITRRSFEAPYWLYLMLMLVTVVALCIKWRTARWSRTLPYSDVD